MGFFDGLGETLKTAGGQATATVGEFFKSEASKNIDNALMKVGIAPKGNLTPEQIAAGEKGAPPQATIAAPQAPEDSILNAVFPVRILGNGNALIWIAAGVGLFLFFRRRK